MSLSPQDIAIIVGALQDSDWDEAVVVVGDARIAVARNGASLPGAAPAAAPAPVAAPAPPVALAAPPAAPAPQPAAVAAPQTATSTDAIVTAPTIGVFWSSPEPGAAAFVQVGDRVAVGDTLCIVEVMKLMTNVTSTAAGTVTAVLAENGGNVEFGTPLFSVREG